MSRVPRTPVLALVIVAALLLILEASASDGQQETPIVIHVEQGGFRWSDAAVGVLAGVGVSLAAAGCLALMRLRGAGNPSRTKGDQP
jgi:hypothetical protein